MFGFYFALPFLLFALYRLFIVLYNYLTRPFLPTSVSNDNPLVSIIASVSISDNNARQLLLSLVNQSYKNLEILVYFDKANINASEIVQEFSKNDSRVKLVERVVVPEGWVSKNFIKDYTSQISKGQFIIFIESDVVVGKEVVANSLSYMLLNNLSLLTIFPQLISDHRLNQALDYLKYWTLISLTPIKRILSNKKPSCSANDHYFMMFESSAYKEKRWHEKYKGFQDLDFVMGRYLKRSKYRIASLLCADEISIIHLQVDVDYASTFFFNFFGRNKNRLLTFVLATTFGPIIAIFLLPFPLVFLYLFAIFFARMLFALLYRKSPFITLLLLPVQHFVLVYLALKFIKTKSGK
jgi:hypothetical protein